MRCVFSVLLLALAGCQAEAPVRVGAKGFTEQRILAQVLAARLEQAALQVDVLECGDTYACQHALRNGRLDMMVEYTGTGLHFAGAPPGAGDLAQLRALYAPFGVDWLVPLGFDNTYAVVVRADRAWRRIEDLSVVKGLRIAVPREYLRRPRDGLNALASRHGLDLVSEPVVVESPGGRYAALLDGRADAAIGYGTDGAIADLGLRVLDDANNFFPAYDAVVIARKDALKARPALAKAVQPLAGTLDLRRMRALNAAVQIEGRDPGVVARRFLVAQKLLDAAKVADKRPELRVTVHRDDDLEPFLRVAHEAVRIAFPDRPVSVAIHAEPARRVRNGDARMAVLGAERFFRPRRLGKKPRDERVEAVAVLGTRALHVVRRSGDEGTPLAGRLGVPVAGSGAARIVDAVLDGAVRPTVRAEVPALLKAVRDKSIDGALFMAEVGDTRIKTAFGDPGLVLRPMAGWLDAGKAARHPYLRPARIRPGAYPNQATATETIEAQVLLAGPRASGAGGGGPAAALPASATPLAAAEVKALAEATKVPEAPDPALPSAWHRTSAMPVARGQAGSVLDLVLNALAIVFTIWLVRVVVARKPEEETS